MLEFFLTAQPARRIVCRNETTYVYFWPYLFTREVPGARPLSRWAARRGAAVHGAVRLQPSDNAVAPQQCYLMVTRPVEQGRALISLPPALALGVSSTEAKKGSFAGRYNPLESLAQLLARELHNPRSPHRPYLEFLYDLHNTATEEEQEALLASLQYGRAGTLTQQLEAMYGGNTLQARGVANAPFLTKEELVSPSQRVEWARLQQMRRRLEQSVPHFAAKSTSWALSMALSRSMEDDDEGRTMYPIIDFCTHSFAPNAGVVVDGQENAKVVRPVQWTETDGAGPCVHLVTLRPLQTGERVTVRWHARPATTQEDAEFWRLRFGYVPSEGNNAKAKR
ncbi:putative mitochondrial hypothetical protein [Leptomonas pyrrhocoris]|uniref:Uncharacterized protein n=1 Tax=Leptomonas pyrrhocoris TaxID=157538 RepID=A0A0M9G5B3_LEPPY|nr:putative mitochondrial hypothetical protein [Leptomonas pyrrhocoris]KPA82449.1 putative mitochondrial hypothetical protein [Leptomonas pyrrhocoris]|eukprot:XP_015660888.1 putative mitochondrial hypothetical protein [Leptomonas pyrrhocoris]